MSRGIVSHAASAMLGELGEGKKAVRVPKTRRELWHAVRRTIGVSIPRQAVCEDHCAPFDAFADAFFSTQADVEEPSTISVWLASRGFGGKTYMLAALSLFEAIVGMKVNLLGGSGEQAERVLDYMNGTEEIFWLHPAAPRHLVRGGFERGVQKKRTTLNNGGWIKALMASSRSVRGPHPERLRLDEVDEMDLSIFDASMGQTMGLRDFREHTVCSSTWHNPGGTMSEVMKRAEESDWPVYEWCYKENLVSNGGWLKDSVVATKQREVTREMWKVEYDLQRPAEGAKAFHSVGIELAFQKELGSWEGKENELISTEKVPSREHRYVLCADWAKKEHFTQMFAFRVEREIGDPQGPLIMMTECYRTRRQEWPVMVEAYVKMIRRYSVPRGKKCAHDGTGLGDVVTDLIRRSRVVSEAVYMGGQAKIEMSRDIVQWVENGWIVFPMIDVVRKEFENCSYDDLFSPGTKNHTPDSVSAAALAVHVMTSNPPKKRARGII